MPWFKVTDNLPTDLATTRLPRSIRNAALGLWVQAGAWSSANLLDGLVPAHMIEELCGTEAEADALVAAGYWERVDEGYRFVDWERDQPTRADVEAKREATKARVQRYRERKLESNAVTEASVTPPPTRPGPTRPDPTMKPRGGGFIRARDDAPPPRYCVKHPEGTPDPCGTCARAREAHQARRSEEVTRPRAAREHTHRPMPDDTCMGCDLLLNKAGAWVERHDPSLSGVVVANSE